MADFNLNCPACRMEYALPADAIPPEGRDVECSGCGHVWHARPPGPGGLLDLGRFRRKAEAERPIPPARQRLSADVLDILQEEVAHERRLRDADAQPARPGTGVGAESGIGEEAASATGSDPAARADAPDLASAPDPAVAPGPAGADAAPDRVAGPPPPLPKDATATDDESPDMSGEPHGTPSDEDADWPATTVVVPVGSTRAMTPTAQPPVVPPEPSASPVLLLRPAALTEARAAAPAPAPAPPPIAEPARPAARSGFGAGVALAVAAAVLAIYLLAPVLAARDLPLAQPAMALHEALDQARLWLARLLPGTGD